MAKELKDYTNRELIDELRSRKDIFSVQVWMREDVESCFPEMTDEEVTEFMERNEEGFDNVCTEEGCDIMADLDR